jgi:alpha-glucosidase
MNIFKQISLAVRPIKLKRFIGSWRYSLQRDWAEKNFPTSPTSKSFQEVGKLEQAQATEKGAIFQFEQAELEITFLTEDFVRIDWKPGKLPVTYSIAKSNWSTIETSLSQTEAGWQIKSEQLQILIQTNGALKFLDATGTLFREELPPQHQAEAWQHQGKLRTEEHIFGLGERAAPLNLRANWGKSYRMWHYDAGGLYDQGTDPLYLCIPVYLGLHSQGSYLIFYENTHSATLTFDEFATANFEGGALRYYFAIGEPTHLINRYTELTGRPALPPRWALGYHQSRWGYETEQAVRDTANGFQIYNLPLSAIHLDIDCKDNFRSFTIDPDRFPKLKEFNQELLEKDVRLIAIVNPGVKADRNSKLFQEGKAQDVFCKLPNGKLVIGTVWPGMCAFPDFTNPQARHWWSRQYEYLLDLGITGFWHDMNEPGAFTLWGDATLPRPTLHHLEGQGGNHVEAHNVYGLMQAVAGYEALRDYQPEKRPFIVSRSGWAGLQRYAWTWTGDVATSWGGLQQTIPTVLGLGLSGIPYSGPDIGGFKGDPSAELYLRWFQTSAFLPFCRTHCANNVKPRTPWSYGEPILSIVREFLHRRYQLIPYFYTLAWEATQTGIPLVRPLFWCDPTDNRLWSVEDVFLVGDGLLVCPVVKEQMRERSVILPAGHWYNFWDDHLLEGPAVVTLDAPLQRIPILVKAGSLIPMEVNGELHLHLYAPITGIGLGTLYSDAGDGYGEWRLDEWRMTPQEAGFQLVWESYGSFEFPYSQIHLHFHGVEVQQAWVDGAEVPVEGNHLQCGKFQQLNLQGNLS